MTSEYEQRVSGYSSWHPKNHYTAERRLGFSRSSLQNILQFRPTLFSYKLHVVQALEDRDCKAHNEFVTWSLHCVALDSSFFNDHIVFNDYAFHGDVKVNKYDERIWNLKSLMKAEKIYAIMKWRRYNTRFWLVVWLNKTTLVNQLSQAVVICSHWIMFSFHCYQIYLYVLSFNTMKLLLHIIAEQYDT